MDHYKIIDTPKRHHKRMNLTGDPASWECWQVTPRLRLRLLTSASD